MLGLHLCRACSEGVTSQMSKENDIVRYMEGPRVIWCPDKEDYVEDPKGIPMWEFWQYA